ncbi:hypothetical protein QYS60_18510 [Rhodococcus sp. GXMU-t2271]|uniref:Secreted protein n=1 Tax=Rhodococcus indonesiensis TaxID=3055869 RepID=A0ABT7RQ06_9NOCA|nr:hypothetical protein [Rhodococcus indonesiensis]MDM7489687.1 hypothetical protein [Rhodococcus indonesiensis]
MELLGSAPALCMVLVGAVLDAGRHARHRHRHVAKTIELQRSGILRLLRRRRNRPRRAAVRDLTRHRGLPSEVRCAPHICASALGSTPPIGPGFDGLALTIFVVVGTAD